MTVYRVLNKPMTLCGADRQLFLAGLFVGLGVFLSLGRFVFGAAIFGLFYWMGIWRLRDRVMLRLFFNGGPSRPQYDPAKFDHTFQVIYDDHRR